MMSVLPPRVPDASLRLLEIDKRQPVVEQRAPFSIPGCRQVALHLHDEEVCQQACWSPGRRRLACREYAGDELVRRTSSGRAPKGSPTLAIRCPCFVLAARLLADPADPALGTIEITRPPAATRSSPSACARTPPFASCRDRPGGQESLRLSEVTAPPDPWKQIASARQGHSRLLRRQSRQRLASYRKNLPALRCGRPLLNQGYLVAACRGNYV
jgi:hypothetical protein